jgi:transglutaminase-like putative cysteine protease
MPFMRTIRKGYLLLALLAGTGLLLARPSTTAADDETAAPLHQRKFEFHYTGSVESIPAGASKVEIWLPYPQNDEHQTITDIHLTAPGQVDISKDTTDGNWVAHLVVEKPEQPIEIDLTFTAERTEYLRRDLPTGATPPVPSAAPADLARWLKPDRLVPLDARIQKLAKEVTAGKTTPLEKARAIYDYVVATMSYDKSGTGWGNGDIYWACDAKRGNCTDFHALFTGLARAAGIPAKFEIGFPLPPEHGQAEVAGYHCWAEFYLTGYGWVPVDASEAKKHLEKKDYFFGGLDENRVQLSVGRDLTLLPRQAGPPLNYFIYPYVEVDGKPYTGIAKKFAFRDLDATVAPAAATAPAGAPTGSK